MYRLVRGQSHTRSFLEEEPDPLQSTKTELVKVDDEPVLMDLFESIGTRHRY
ncbi:MULTISPECIES: hypothetical protein [unclassified Exiguobacterium]|uniref:hypothetical protein n=1 Tax=unclassified Exiguobacterium TaxID=2644629 RepID=UPI001BEB54A1|nr:MULTISPECIES: hypothetical protein [unclassified Exiguobacterium]